MSTFYSQAYNTTLSGTNYADEFNVTHNRVTVYGKAGNDSIAVTSNGNSLFGDDGNDVIAAQGNNNFINGDVGDDTLLAGGEDNYFFSGSGNDSIIATGNYNTAFGEDGNDTIVSDGEYNGLHGGNGNDQIHALDSNAYVYGDEGNDELFVETFEDTGHDLSNIYLEGGEGTDFFILNPKEYSISASIDDFAANVDSIALINLDSQSLTYSLTNNNLRFTDPDGKVDFTLRGVSDIDQIAGSRVAFTDLDENGIYSNTRNRTFREVVSNYYYDMPTGLNKNIDDQILYVNSEYDGGVWLYGFDIFNGTETFADGAVKAINALNDSTSGRILTGNNNANIIFAGFNGAWMWGAAGNDWLCGNDGEDMFWYGKGEGADVVMDCGDEDLVNLYSIELGDITYLDINDENRTIGIGLAEGEGLTISASDVATSTTIQLSDGSRWKYSYNDRNWSYAQ